MRVKDEEDFVNTIEFLEKEAKIDAENCIEMLNIEPSHLTKGKIKEMGLLKKRYEKASKSLIKKYKDTNAKKKEHERYGMFIEKKTWLIK